MRDNLEISGFSKADAFVAVHKARKPIIARPEASPFVKKAESGKMKGFIEGIRKIIKNIGEGMPEAQVIDFSDPKWPQHAIDDIYVRKEEANQTK